MFIIYLGFLPILELFFLHSLPIICALFKTNELNQ